MELLGAAAAAAAPPTVTPCARTVVVLLVEVGVVDWPVAARAFRLGPAGPELEATPPEVVMRIGAEVEAAAEPIDATRAGEPDVAAAAVVLVAVALSLLPAETAAGDAAGSARAGNDNATDATEATVAARPTPTPQ